MITRRLSGPGYGGKALSSWLVLLQSTNLVEREEAEAAVREIGTNAVPILTAWLSHRDSAPEKWLSGWLARTGVFTRDRFSENYYRSKALCGFRVLGPTARPAISDLRKLIVDTDRGLSLYASYALALVAPAEAQKLVEEWSGVTNRNLVVSNLRKALVMRNVFMESQSAGHDHAPVAH